MVGTVKAAYHHWPLIAVGSCYFVGGEQYNAGVPLVAVDAKIAAPFVHSVVPHHIGCPHISVDVVGIVSAFRPVHGIECGEIHLLSAFHHLGHLWCHKGFGIRGYATRSICPGGVCSSPVAHVGGIGTRLMRTKDIVSPTGAVEHHRGVVHTDSFFVHHLVHGSRLF